MGVDIGGYHYNWHAWGVLFDLGRAFGWEPAGTLMPVETEDEAGGYQITHAPDLPRGGYFSNDYQMVTGEDAAAWAAALHRALVALTSGKVSAEAAMARCIVNGDKGPPLIESLHAELADAGVADSFTVVKDSDIEGLVREFAELAAGGCFTIG